MFEKMKTQSRAAAEQALDTHAQITDWQLQQMKLAEKQATSAIEAGRSSMEISNRTAQAMGKAMVDAMFPATEESK